MAEVVVDQEGPLREYFQGASMLSTFYCPFVTCALESGDLLGRTIPGGLDVIPEASESDELDQINLLQLIVLIVMVGSSVLRMLRLLTDVT